MLHPTIVALRHDGFAAFRCVKACCVGHPETFDDVRHHHQAVDLLELDALVVVVERHVFFPAVVKLFVGAERAAADADVDQVLDLAQSGLSQVSETVNEAGQTVQRLRNSSGQLFEVVTDSADRIVSSQRISQ